MGDRTTTDTTIAASDLETTKELLFGADWKNRDWKFDDEHPNGDGTATFRQYGVNYGGDYDADKLEKAGVPFVIDHDAGSEYGPGCIAFDGNSRASVEASNGTIMVAFDEATGEARPDDLVRAREFAAVRRQAFAAMIARSAKQRGGL